MVTQKVSHNGWKGKYAPRGHRGLATDCSEPGPGQNPGQMQAGGWQWLLVSLNTAEEGVARCESPERMFR